MMTPTWNHASGVNRSTGVLVIAGAFQRHTVLLVS
jgi:hypothetical protein